MTSLEQFSDLEGHFAPPTLPLERPRSIVQSDKRNSVSLALNRDQGFGAPRDNAQLVAAISIVLARYEAAEAITLGISQCTRGFRLSLSTIGDDTVGSLEAKVAGILGRLGSTNTSIEPQVPLEEFSTDSSFLGIVVVLDEMPPPSIRQDVTIRLLQDGVLAADFDARAFRTDVAENFLAHVGRTIASLQDAPSTTIAQAGILNDIEHSRILALSTNSQRAYHGTLRDLFELSVGLLVRHSCD